MFGGQTPPGGAHAIGEFPARLHEITPGDSVPHFEKAVNESELSIGETVRVNTFGTPGSIIY